MTRAPILFAILALSAAAHGVPIQCSAQTPFIGHTRRAWDSLAARAHSGSPAAAASLNGFHERYGLPLMFMLGKAVPAGSRFYLDDGPCGPVGVAFCHRVPTHHPTLDADRAWEFDTLGTITTRWALPWNSAPEGIDGSALLVEYAMPQLRAGVSVHLGIQPDGDLRVLAGAPASTPQITACPAFPGVRPSRYLTCQVFRDQRTGTARRVAFYQPCS